MGWKGKLIGLLFVYFAGFATAIYCLAPVPEDQAREYGRKEFPYSVAKSDQFAKSFNVGLRKWLDFTRDAAARTTEYVKRKVNEKETDRLTGEEADPNTNSY